jgi:hypothetical protein
MCGMYLIIMQDRGAKWMGKGVVHRNFQDLDAVCDMQVIIFFSMLYT